MADPDRRFSPATYWIGHIATLVSIFAVFAALGIAYLVRANNPTYWRPVHLPWQLWLSTLLLLLCSGAIEMARFTLRDDDGRGYAMWLIRTAWLAAAFLVSQSLCWRILAQNFTTDDQNRGLFFVLTGAHALHIVGGMAALGYLIYRVWHPWDLDGDIRRRTITFMLATYWHFMAVIWLVMFAMFAYIAGHP